jgi:hypothetical protein
METGLRIRVIKWSRDVQVLSLSYGCLYSVSFHMAASLVMAFVNVGWLHQQVFLLSYFCHGSTSQVKVKKTMFSYR